MFPVGSNIPDWSREGWGGGGPTKDCPWSSRLGFSVGLVTPPQSMGLYSGELIIGKICASEI